MEPTSLTADGANGVVENVDSEVNTVVTAKKAKKGSMMAEAEQTQDQELAEEFGQEDEDSEMDAAPALLTGFDSDNDDTAEDKNFDATRVAPIPQFKKTSKKLRKAEQSKSGKPGVVYVGRIPHGFYEAQMREYFTQFGTISRLRVSRNKKTGASKHFAFIEFESDEVAKIVAETMDNYLMFGHILKCKYAPEGTLHEDVWKGANKKYRKIPHHKLAREKAEEPKTEEQIEKKMRKEQKKREGNAKKLKAIGYEYELPELKKPEAIEIPLEKQAELEDKVEGAIVPPATVPKDELATKVEEDVKKAKKSKKATKAVEAEPIVKESKPAKAAKVKAAVPEEKPKKTSASDKPKADKKEKKLKGILKKPSKG